MIDYILTLRMNFNSEYSKIRFNIIMVLDVFYNPWMVVNTTTTTE